MKKTKQFFSLSIGRAGVGPLLMALVMMAMSPTMMWAGGTKPSGSGTIDAPYIITSEANLIWFRDAVNGTNTGTDTGTNICAKLNADITLTSAWADTPIGTSTKKYKGTFNGNKKTISGLSGSHGLFAYTTGTVDKSNTSSTENIAIIKDLTLEGSISASTDNIGSFVEHAEGSTRLYRVESKVGITITGAKTHIGGIMGGYYHTEGEQLRLNGCTYSGAMNVGSSTDSNGGIIGFCEKDANVQINHCFFAGSITSSGSNPTIGGILGYARDDTDGTQNFSYLQNCFCSGSIKGSGTGNMGIFVGYPNGSNVVDNITNNTYVANSNSSTGINMLGHSQTAASSNKAITISVKAGSNGTVSTSYVNPTADANTLLQVKATPADHYHLSSWSDGGEQTHTKELTSDINVTATFAINQHTITIKRNYDYRSTISCTLNGNTLTPTMETIDGHECYKYTFDYGAEPVFTVNPAQYCEWNKWADGNTDQSRTYTVKGDATLTANCNKTSYTLTLQANNDAMGTVSEGGSCDAFNDVSITATPNEGYHFVNWTKDGTVVSTSASCKYRAHGNETLVANFHQLTAHTVTDATCTETGISMNYWTCATCNKHYSDNKGTTETTLAAVTIAAKGHDFTSQTTDEAYLKSAATCTEAATYYYQCSRCDEKGTESYASTEDKDKAKGHDFTSQTATEAYLKTAATCTEAATYYHKCSRCDEKGSTYYTSTEEKDKALGHSIVHVDAIAAKCGATGNTEHWKCTACGKLFNDAECTSETTLAAVTIPAKGHDFTSQTTTATYLKSAATCTEAATYYHKCSRCEEKGSTYYTSTEDKDKAKGHSIVKVDAKTGNCGDDGIIDHWKCTTCGMLFSDAEGHTETTLAEVTTTRATGEHSWSDDSHTYCTTCNHSWIYYTAKAGTAEQVTPYLPSALPGYDDANNTYDSTTTQGVMEFTSKLTSIGEGAFSGRGNLQSITIPSSVTSIGEFAFHGCTALQSITIPSSVTSIGGHAFARCSNLTSINILEGVTSIGNNAFQDCTGLTSITIPSSVTSIGNRAFDNSGLQSITIPSSVTSIGVDAFNYCNSLDGIAFNSIPYFESITFDYYGRLNKTLALTDESYVAADKGEFPDLTKAPTYTRTLTTEWETIVVPFAVTITDNDNYEFYTISGVEGSNLLVTKATGTLAAGTPVLIHKKVAGDYALTLYGDAEEERKYPVSTTINNPAAISGLTLTGTYANAKVATGNGYVFDGNRFVKTTEATQVAPFHAYLSGAIDGVDAITPQVHAHNIAKVDAVAATCSATGITEHWKCTGCGMLFSDAEGMTETTLKEVTIAEAHNWSDDSHTYCTTCHLDLRIYYSASEELHLDGSNFGTNLSITSHTFNIIMGIITFSGPVTCIGDGAFAQCSYLRSIAFPSSVTSIGAAAFLNCYNLQSITIPSSVTSIGDSAFMQCSSLTNVAFNSIPMVEVTAFNDCPNLYTKTLSLTDDSYVAADKGDFPALTAQPTFTRTLTTEWETIVVPFAVTITDNDNYEFYSISGVEGSNLQTTKATGTLAAGTPVLIHKKVAGDYALTLSGVAEEERKYPVSTDTNNPEAISGLTLTGTYANAEVTTGAGYVFDGNRFVKTTKATNVAPFHAYLDGAIDGVEAIKLPGVIIPGDLNDDGLFTIADLTLLVQLLNSNGTITNPAADVDRDGSVDINDVNALRNKLLGK